MRWAALYRRPPILRDVSASQIRARHAANRERIAQAQTIKPAQQRSNELMRSFDVYLHQRISYWDRRRTKSPDWIDRRQLGRPLRHLASRPHLARFPGLRVNPVHFDPY